MLVAVLLMALSAGSQRLELPIDDTPFNQRHGLEPSMEESLQVTLSLTFVGDWALEQLLDRAFEGKPGWSRMLAFVPATAAWSMLLSQVPLGLTWMHEEWHRAVLASNGVHSRNGVYSTPPFSFATSVDHVSDAELAAFKASSPAAFVRMSAAGLESQVEFNRRIERQWFFDDRPPFRDHAAIVWSQVNTFVYLLGCATISDQLTDSFNATETEVEKRDFTGMDCTGWAYDLEHPNQPYAARGVHPSGVGINRYRSWRDLSPSGRSFLQVAAGLSLLGFVTPGWAAASLPGVRGTRWSFAFFHQLTSFGQTVDFELYLRLPFGDFLAVYHQYFDQKSPYPGLELGVVRYPVSETVQVSLTLAGWVQPAVTGGMLRLNALWRAAPHAYVWVESDLKTAGWVSGVVYLDPAIQLRVGVGALL